MIKFKIAIAILISVFESITRVITECLAIVRVKLLNDYDYLRWLKRDLADCESIMELGCGSNSPILKIGLGKRTTTCDIFDPYILKHNQAGDYKSCYLANILTMDLPVKKFDAVVMFDVLEHLERNEVFRVKLFERMEQAAIKKVIFFTPNGFVSNPDVDGDIYQRHLSAWEPVDYLKRGYRVRGATGLRSILGVGAIPNHFPVSIFTIIAMVSQPFIFNHPNQAWHSYAVKEIK